MNFGDGMTEIELVDNKGDFWRLTFATCQLDKRDGMWYGLWFVDEDCPAFLRTNGARYEFVPLPVFTEWFYDKEGSNGRTTNA